MFDCNNKNYSNKEYSEAGYDNRNNANEDGDGGDNEVAAIDDGNVSITFETSTGTVAKEGLLGMSIVN